jgi:hypothetical protein
MPSFRRDDPSDLPFLYLDAETIPTRDPDVLAEIAEKHVVHTELPEIKPAANLKDPVKIQADIEARTARAKSDLEERLRKAEADHAEAIRQTALSTTDAHIVSIALAIGEEEVVAAHVGHFIPSVEPVGFEVIDISGLGFDDILSAEARLLEAFWAAVTDAAGEGRSAIPVGHHLIGFDLPLLRQRSIILGVKPPSWWPVDPAPWDRSVVDTMTAFAGRGGRIGLKKLAQRLRLPVPATRGSDVHDLVQKGRLDLVASYNGDDVRLARSVHRRIMFMPPLASDIDALRISSGQMPSTSAAASDILSTTSADASDEPHLAQSVENEPAQAHFADPLDDLIATVPTASEQAA